MYLPRLCLGLVLLILAAPRIPASAQSTVTEVLVEQELFTDDMQWNALVRVDLDNQDAEALTDRLQGIADSAASGEGGSDSGFTRGSIDVDLVTALITDRAQQVGMRAIADAITSIGGPGADRQYVRDVLEVTRSLLLESGGLQRTHVERLVQVLARVVLSEALVRTRFPRVHRLNQQEYWERRLCRPGHGLRNASPSTADHCARIRFGFPEEEVSATTLHLYLIDLAYWRLGASGFFPYEASPPVCPFRFNEAGNTLCQAVVEASSDTVRDERVDWLLNLNRVLDGLLFVRSLQPVWNARGAGARGLLRALLDSQAIGSFGRTVGLRTQDWSGIGELVDSLSAVHDLGTFARDFLLINPRVDIGAELDDDGLRIYAGMPNRATSLLRRLEQNQLCVGAEGDDSQATLCEHLSSLTQWLQRFDREESSGESDEGLTKLPTPPTVLTDLLDGLRGQLTRLEEVIGVADGSISASARLELRLVENTRALSDRVWTSSRQTGQVRRLAELRLTELASILTALQNLVEVASSAIESADVLSRDLWDWREHPAAGSVRRTLRTLRGTLRLLRLLSTVNVHAARDTRLDTVAGALRGVASLGHRDRRDNVQAWLLHFLEPVLPYVIEGRRFDTPLLFQLASRIESRDLLAAMGFDQQRTNACESNPSSLACWMVRIAQALREATQISANGVRVNGDQFRHTLASLGDDFRRRHEWRTYFHLTIGMGQIGVLGAPSASTGDGLTFAPLVSEQIGIGWASPSFFGERLTFRTGLYGSGLLYRAVLDSAESDSVMFGAFAALDLYELLEVYVAPTLILYPSTSTEEARSRFALSFGAQVPLGDYLSDL